MKHLRKILTAVLIIAGIMLAGAVTPPPALVRQVKAEIEQNQYMLPMRTGPGISLTKMWYIPDKYTVAYKYVYDSTTKKPTTKAIAEMKQGIIHMLKANPEAPDYQMVYNGIIFHYNYYNPDGTFLFAVKITPTDLR